MVTRTLFLTIALLGGATLAARTVDQQPAADTPKFDVASITRNTSGRPGGSSGVQPGGRYVVTNMTTLPLVQTAYNVERFQVVGAPGWLDSERYDVTAVSEGGFRGGRLQPLLQSLLAERFRLVAHKETRILPAYALVRSRANGEFGPRLKPWTIDCAALRAAGKMPPPPQTLAELSSLRPCVSSAGAGMFVGGGVPVIQLVNVLRSTLNTPVIDETRLEGDFEIALRWNPDLLAPQADPSIPSLFTALQEQLGLKLEGRQQPVEVVVIDRIERPTEN
jgi:uncharacterized protein (TIGR03435 family)